MKRNHERGSSLILAVFVLALVSSMGISLLFLSHTEVQLSESQLQSKKAFYIAEAGLEDARRSLFVVNGQGPFGDDLDGIAGGDDFIDFTVDGLQVTFDLSGTPTALGGFDDDSPFVALTAFGEGWYAAFLTNDALDNEDSINDSNDRIRLIGVGIGPDHSLEVVEAIVEPKRPLPIIPPSTITLLGPAPDFQGGTSNPSTYVGDDCGVTGGNYVPVVGTIGPGAESSAEAGIDHVNGPDYESGPFTGDDAFADLTDPSEPSLALPGNDTIEDDWTDCVFIQETLLELKAHADFYCLGDACALPLAFAADDIVFIEGDIDLGPGDSGSGILVVTGAVEIGGQVDWDGVVAAIGEGVLTRDGAGNGKVRGATFVADIAGPDDIYGTSDDCTGGDGGFDSATYHVNGGGNGDVEFCSTKINLANPIETYSIEEFRQN